MTVQHKIDKNSSLITTILYGEATDSQLIEALTKYQQSIKNQPAYDAFNEIVDCSNVSKFTLSTEGIKKLVEIAAQTDIKGIKTKLAIIVTKPVAYGVARLYTIYRSLQPHVIKEVRIFMKYDDALKWVERTPD